MKQVKLLFSLLLFCASATLAQFKVPAIDKSPMDMAYYPVNYPVLKIQNKVSEPLMARIIYSRPLKNGRSVFGELVEYGQIWRLGANEATEIEIYKDVKCGTDTKLKKGRYTMYAIPYQDKWTIIFNKETDIWGLSSMILKKMRCGWMYLPKNYRNRPRHLRCSLRKIVRALTWPLCGIM